MKSNLDFIMKKDDLISSFFLLLLLVMTLGWLRIGNYIRRTDFKLN